MLWSTLVPAGTVDAYVKFTYTHVHSFQNNGHFLKKFKNFFGSTVTTNNITKQQDKQSNLLQAGLKVQVQHSNETMASLKELYTFARSSNSNVDVTCDSSCAIVDGKYVIGRTTNESSFVKWQTQVNGDVSRLTSTADGSVLAVSTEDQVILSLMRARDGKILVSRSIKPKANEEEGKHDHLFDYLLSCSLYKDHTNELLRVSFRISIAEPWYYVREERYYLWCQGCANSTISHSRHRLPRTKHFS